MSKTIGVTTSGGDSPGLNAVIAAVVKRGTQLGYDFVGFQKGLEGTLSPIQFMHLDLSVVQNISHLSGTILKTTNHGKFGAKVGAGELALIPDEVLNESKANLEKMGIDALVVVGGDGTISGAMQLADKGVDIVSVPKSIDNDLQLTDMTFGFDTASNTIADALRNIHSTAESHERVIIVETMGRYTGWLALYGGIGGDADMIIIPESPFDTNKVVEYLRGRHSENDNATVIVIAEGAKEAGMEEYISGKSGASEISLGGISKYLEKRIGEVAPDEFEVRTVELGHVQRGGTPSVFDRALSARYGVAAIDAVKRGDFGKMVALQGSDIVTVPMKDAVKELKRVDLDSEIIKTAKGLGIHFGN